MQNGLTTMKPNVKIGFLTSINKKTFRNAPDVRYGILNVQDACSPVKATYEFTCESLKQRSTHVALILFGQNAPNISKESDTQYVVLKSLRDNKKLLLRAPVDAFQHREYFRFERVSYKK